MSSGSEMNARYWKSHGDKVICRLCPHNCIIIKEQSGFCGVRKNVDGRLESLSYGKAVSVNIDPIEKKPMYHFLPGSKSLSIGTVGCNLKCLHCQNWEISTTSPGQIKELDLPPEVVVQLAIDKGCESISYTYNEPTIFHEYATDIAKIARSKGIKNVIVTNGYISEEAANDFCQVMDGANIDLKAFSDNFYKEVCKASLQPVLNAIKKYHERIWIEITNLIIEEKNDSLDEIERMCKWIKENAGVDTPIHFSRSFPMHKMKNINPTPEDTLLKAKEIAGNYLNYVYVGNVNLEDCLDTFCPACKKLVIARSGGGEKELSMSGRCSCGEKIMGVWD